MEHAQQEQLLAKLNDRLANHNLRHGRASAIAYLVRAPLWGGVVPEIETQNGLRRIRSWIEAAKGSEIVRRCGTLVNDIEDHAGDLLPADTAPEEAARQLLFQELDLRIQGKTLGIVQANRAMWWSATPGESVAGEQACWPAQWWGIYERNLKEHRGFSDFSIDSLRERCSMVMNGLRRPAPRASVRAQGLVIGHIQSGKTASMAGLIAMAADAGYNVFIVLAGTKENLRRQTQKRMEGDLAGIPRGGHQRRNMHTITSKDRPGLNGVDNQSFQHFVAALGVDGKCIGVVLKHGALLRRLRNWLVDVPESARILLIDDEADQASLNANAPVFGQETEEDLKPAAINGRIRDILNGTLNQDPNPRHATRRDKVAYVAYTATPFGPLLNEFGEDTLYPADFIRHLPRPADYIGSQEIGGVEEGADGLNMLRIIPEQESTVFRTLDGTQAESLAGTPPEAFRKALLWFLVATAEMRLRWRASGKEHLPHTTMMIHIDHLTQQHALVETLTSAIIEGWRSQPDGIREEARNVMAEEAGKIGPAEIARVKPQYSGPITMQGRMHDFDTLLWPEILRVFEERLDDTIQIDNTEIDGEPSAHLSQPIAAQMPRFRCLVDNSRRSRDQRLFYPSATHLHQIVIGGGTLARGLTLEGLVSTYFCRNSNQMDSLLQMGRWYGYRFGYEDLPRIWLTGTANALFAEGRLLEKELEEEAERYERERATPRDFGIRIKSNPGGIKLTTHMRGAMPVGYDYSHQRPQTILFERNEAWLRANWKAGEDLINQISSGEPGVRTFLDVERDHVLEFLSRYRTVSDAIRFNSEWLHKFIRENKNRLDLWNVVVVSGEEREGGFGPLRLPFVRRSQLTTDGLIDIKALMSKQDILADEKELHDQGATAREKMDIRSRNELNPLLLLYPVYGRSRAAAGSQYRHDLDLPDGVHVLGAAMVFTGTPLKSSGGEIVEIDTSRGESS